MIGRILVALVVVGCTASWPLIGQWATVLSGPDADQVGTHSLLPTSDGGYLLVGATASFGLGGYDGLVIKIRADGSIEWEQTIGGSGTDWFNEAAEALDGSYVLVGWTQSFGRGDDDVWVVKVGRQGEVIWQRRLGGLDFDRGIGICQLNNGNFCIVAHTRSFGFPKNYLWIIYMTPNGEIVWQRCYSPTAGRAGVIARAIVATADGGCFAMARIAQPGDDLIWLLKLSLTGLKQWSKVYASPAAGSGVGNSHSRGAIQTRGGGYAVIWGVERKFRNAYHRDFWVIKLDAFGRVQWAKVYGGRGEDRDDWGLSIQQTSDGGYVAAGITSSFGAGGWDWWLLRLDSSGQILWQRTIGGNGEDTSPFIRELNTGHFIIAGNSTSFGDGDGDILLLNTNSSGLLASCPPSGLETGPTTAFSVDLIPQSQRHSVHARDCQAAFRVTNALVNPANFAVERLCTGAPSTTPYLVTQGIPYSPVSSTGETFFTTSLTIWYQGGRVLLARDPDGTGEIMVDDVAVLTVRHPDGSESVKVIDFTDGCGHPVLPLPPQDITDLFHAGRNEVTLVFKDQCGGNGGSTRVYLIVL